MGYLMSKELHNEIAEAVKQGIVSSKQVESNMLGSFQSTLKEHGVILEGNAKALDKLNEKVGFQNGRVTETEKEIVKLQQLANQAKIWTSATRLFGIIIISMALWVFFDQIATLNLRINELVEDIRTRTIPSSLRL